MASKVSKSLSVDVKSYTLLQIQLNFKVQRRRGSTLNCLMEVCGLLVVTLVTLFQRLVVCM